MVDFFKLLWFWIVAFAYLMWGLMRNKRWHNIIVNLEIGTDANGTVTRKIMTARQIAGKCVITNTDYHL